MVKFRIIESNIGFLGRVFRCNTQIRQTVDIPFDEEPYRCVMFNGLQIKLVNKDKYIIGNIH